MQAKKNVSGKMLCSSEEIMTYLRISFPLFQLFLRLKMPAVQINGRWRAHTDNLDDWWKKVAASQAILDVPE